MATGTVVPWNVYAVGNVVPWVWTKYYISVDIGSRNFAIRIEPEIDGVVKPAEHFDLVDLAPNNENLDQQTLNLSYYLNTLAHILVKCNYLIIEQQQLIRNQISNATRNMRLMQHLLSYFQQHYPYIQRIELPATFKTSTQLMAAPTNMTREQRKRWGAEVAIQMLRDRNDTMSLAKINQVSKWDDLTDTIVQIEAYKRWCVWKQQNGDDAILDTSPRNTHSSRRRKFRRTNKST